MHLVDHISKRIVLPVDADFLDSVGLPGRKPAGLVVYPVISQELLGRKAQYLPVADQTGYIIVAGLEAERQAYCHGNVFAVLPDYLQLLQGRLIQPFTQEHIFTAIAGDAKLGQAKDVNPGLPGLSDGFPDILKVVFPMDGGLIEGSSGNAEFCHQKRVLKK
jgi:hypothetical protein